MTQDDSSARCGSEGSDPQLGAYYDNSFYGEHIDASLRSARVFLGHFWKFLQPKSVLDVGCGRGAWLKAAHELGAETLLGFDGAWNDQEGMLDPQIRFTSIDLNDGISADVHADLAISVEVAEHVDPSSSERFVRSLTAASEAVLFSAAYPGQGGAHHVNERPQSYWAGVFASFGYVPFDLFRPYFWGDDTVAYWYRQNAFLYLRKDSAAYDRVRSRGVAELPNAGFMDCVHPTLFETARTTPVSLKAHLRDLFPSAVRTARRFLR
jgi:hypothetical protein